MLPSQIHTKRILIAEDSAHIQELLQDLFLSRGYEVFQAFDGNKAVEVFDSAKPHIVMLDIRMPRQSGIQVLRHIRSITSDTTVVMMTAHGSEEIAVEAMKIGANDYLTKPLSCEKVIHIVEELAEKNRVKLENMRLTEKIRETESYLAHLIDSVNEAIISIDAEGNIRSFNRAAEILWHVPESDAIGSPISVIFKNGEKNGYVKKIMDITKKAGLYEGEFAFVRKDSSEFAGYLSTSAMKNGEEKKGGIVAVIRDLTSEKMLRAQVVESAKLASLGKVVEGIAHEVRNPLITMGGLARRMEQGIDEEGNHKKYLKVILDDVDRLEKMVADIEEYVDFARRNRHHLVLLNLRDVIMESLSGFDLASADIRLAIDETGLPEIYGDRDSLKVLFDNLFENAIDAMPGGGMLYVRFGQDDTHLHVYISDTGCGIPKEKLGDIYDPFFTSKMSGIGIGLSKVYIITDEHHGFISVDTEEGKGTTFTLKFPLEKRQEVRA